MGEVENFFLQHSQTPAPYDPAKRHEAYLRNRHLKGRKRGVGLPPINSGGHNNVDIKKAAEHRTAELLKRLDAVKLLLKKLNAEVKQLNSKLNDGNNSSEKAHSGRSGGRKKMTNTQKAESRKRSKEYYKKHKKESGAQGDAEIRQQIAEVEKKIETAKQKLRDALEQSKRSHQKVTYTTLERIQNGT